MIYIQKKIKRKKTLHFSCRKMSFLNWFSLQTQTNKKVIIIDQTVRVLASPIFLPICFSCSPRVSSTT